MSRKTKIFVLLTGILVGVSLLAFCIYKATEDNQHLIVTLSISSDGRYVFSIDAKKQAVLWDIQKKKKQIISEQANMYSAYWIKDTPYFMWQELPSGIVFVKNTENFNTRVTMTEHYMIFGQTMGADLRYNVFSDSGWNIHVGDGQIERVMIRSYDNVPGFDGANKLINFTFLGNDKLLTSGLAAGNADDPKDVSGIFLWDLKTRKVLHDYIGNVGKTFATISPDGQYVVAGDEGGGVYVWQTQSGKKVVDVDDLVLGQWNPKITDPHKSFDPSVITAKQPADFGDNTAANRGIISLKFIDATHYLAFISRYHDSTPYALLYQVDSPRLIKYIPLGSHPYPALQHYERDQAIDTAPTANILVMAKETKPGILVYQYDPNKKSLTKIWDAK